MFPSDLLPTTRSHPPVPFRFVYDLDIPLINGRVPFHKTAFELVKRVSQSKIPEGAGGEEFLPCTCRCGGWELRSFLSSVSFSSCIAFISQHPQKATSLTPHLPLMYVHTFTLTGAVKSQLDKMTKRFFKDLKDDELLNFSVAVVVMKVQRRWRSRVR